MLPVVFLFFIFLFSVSCDLYGDDVRTADDSALLFLGRGRFNFGIGEKAWIAFSIAEVPATGIAVETGIAVGTGIAAGTWIAVGTEIAVGTGTGIAAGTGLAA